MAFLLLFFFPNVEAGEINLILSPRRLGEVLDLLVLFSLSLFCPSLRFSFNSGIVRGPFDEEQWGRGGVWGRIGCLASASLAQDAQNFCSVPLMLLCSLTLLIGICVLDHHVTYRGVIECNTMALAQWGQLDNATFSTSIHFFSKTFC